MANIKTKKSQGQYFTEKSPFNLMPYLKWHLANNIKNKKILEPFAGSNNLINFLKNVNLIKSAVSYDIKPANPNVIKRDTIKNFPTGFEVIISNPPWLYKSSASRQNIKINSNQYDDLYKYCLELCLKNSKYVAVLIPATFLQTGLFRNRLDTYIFLQDKDFFNDTKNPVALALFSPQPEKTKIYFDNKFIGCLNDLESKIPKSENEIDIKFNCKNGNLGFVSFDNTKENSIRFCLAQNINKKEIKNSSRMITKISIKDIKITKRDIEKLNANLNTFRKETYDIFLTPFKGIKKDGIYRKRMSYKLARDFLKLNLLISK